MNKRFKEVIQAFLHGDKVRERARDNIQIGNNYLYSYRHYKLAYRYDDGFVLINSQIPPSKTTRRQLNVLLTEAKNSAKIPFPALERAGILQDYMEYIEIGPDFYYKDQHFMGETLFKYRDNNFYLSGLDREDRGSKRHFYLCQLPYNLNITSINMALESLKPKGLDPIDFKRQGEWFFNPVKINPKERIFCSKMPICFEKASDYFTKGVREGRHIAGKMCLSLETNHVYVKGFIDDTNHSRLHLTDWHRVLRNCTVNSWATDGTVD